VTAAADFIDAALQYEASWYRAQEDQARLGGGLRFYGSSVGAVRGTIRDAARRHPGLSHDEITALCSELWEVPVYERRLAAIVLLQSNVALLLVSDLTRIEGFVRSAGLRELVDPLAGDVIRPLVASLDARDRARASTVLARWRRDGDAGLARAAELAADTA
jgi:DNA alkylation repair enzyme